MTEPTVTQSDQDAAEECAGVVFLSVLQHEWLEQAFARHRQAAILEGMEIMREAAIDWLKAMDGYGEWWEAAQLIHDNLAASAILAAHTRAKAMGELIAGDADLL